MNREQRREKGAAEDESRSVAEMAVPATSVVVLDRGNNTTCTVNLHGATVVSWRVNNQEQLFVSKQAIFDGKRAIRGGIPIVFPQFGAWSTGPQHGFARISRWELKKPPERLPTGDVEAIFQLLDNEFTRSMWNYPFSLTYRLILREKELHFNLVQSRSRDTVLHPFVTYLLQGP
ncbi:putative glucose-6-phosphate 1-epimerase isoform X2 [Penaeus vannamei]|uniref:Galactose mutarotase n=1 Tax=Penaeus vannamei TaxID=6689 RepID=A0A423S9R7_PENVA|nr:putative glucose-6-phosphate 1-epimerase isoform X2 [Penaeus vannamei]